VHVRYSAAALQDLSNIRDYVRPRNPQAYERMYGAITTLCEQLGQFPFLGRPGRVTDTREFSVTGYPYVIVYTVNEPYSVDIEHIIHARSQWPRDQDR